jgi:hypothetical protein
LVFKTDVKENNINNLENILLQNSLNSKDYYKKSKF